MNNKLQALERAKTEHSIIKQGFPEQEYIETLDEIEKELKAIEIIKETPIFAWYVIIYKNAYEMVADAKGFRVNNSVEELQQMFDLLKEILTCTNV